MVHVDIHEYVDSRAYVEMFTYAGADEYAEVFEHELECLDDAEFERIDDQDLEDVERRSRLSWFDVRLQPAS